ncbi:hypothetical protein V490_06728 [Pseudogymnoascus sp. VKM F-3557]|nr:hypothetical protein V490_06728 [Pseudogymnoascus sp. VKM F-3557]
MFAANFPVSRARSAGDAKGGATEDYQVVVYVLKRAPSSLQSQLNKQTGSEAADGSESPVLRQTKQSWDNDFDVDLLQGVADLEDLNYAAMDSFLSAGSAAHIEPELAGLDGGLQAIRGPYDGNGRPNSAAATAVTSGHSEFEDA